MWTESQIALFLINFDRRGFFLHLVAFLDFPSIETKFNHSQNIGKISKKLTKNGETTLANGNRLKGIKYPSLCAVLFFRLSRLDFWPFPSFHPSLCLFLSRGSVLMPVWLENVHTHLLRHGQPENTHTSRVHVLLSCKAHFYGRAFINSTDICSAIDIAWVLA